MRYDALRHLVLVRSLAQSCHQRGLRLHVALSTECLCRRGRIWQAWWKLHALRCAAQAAGEPGHLNPVASPPESPRAPAAAQRQREAPAASSSAPADVAADLQSSAAAPRSPPTLREGTPSLCNLSLVSLAVLISAAKGSLSAQS